MGKVYNALLGGEKKTRTFEVLSDNEDGTFDVRWDDGDEEWNYVADLESMVKAHQEWANEEYKSLSQRMLEMRNKGARLPVGRPAIGETKKVSLTLPTNTWEYVDSEADGNRAEYLRKLIDRDMFNREPWSNNACLGYAILGAQKLGYSEEQLQKLVRAIYSEFDFKSIKEARAIYEQSPY
ncbi:hypothetical protein [Paenibacillus sp. UNC496MF]|uniref:hypothetical protein n=1 Tax=Paenibacillus sp. UNC496MF TaxID=1502753 RepID=UPI000B818F50|nr:hypothetical protein [Paenibacillus sp. UNC496MF]